MIQKKQTNTNSPKKKSNKKIATHTQRKTKYEKYQKEQKQMVKHKNH